MNVRRSPQQQLSFLRFQKTQPFRHRCRWKDVSARLAGPDLLVVIELLIDHGDLARNIALIHDSTEYQFVAFLTEPGKLFFFFIAPFALDYQSPGVFISAWRMRQIAGTNENLSLFDRHDLSPLARWLQMQLHVAFDLIEELIAGLDMKIEPSIRPAQNHHQEIFVMDDQ